MFLWHSTWVFQCEPKERVICWFIDFLPSFFCRMEVMKTQKAVYLLQGNTSHVYPIAYLLDNCLEDFCTCLRLENYSGCLSVTKSSFSWLSAWGQFLPFHSQDQSVYSQHCLAYITYKFSPENMVFNQRIFPEDIFISSCHLFSWNCVDI